MPRKPPSNRFDPSASLRLTHQPKFSSSLVNTRMRKSPVATAVDQVDLPGRPGMHRRVDVAERPFVGGQLPVWVHRPLPAHQQQLLLGELRVDVGERDAVEREIPGGEPRVLPLVRHGDDVGEREVLPGRVARTGLASLRRRRRLGRVALEPFVGRCTGRAACPTAARRTPAARWPRPPRTAGPVARVGRTRRPRACGRRRTASKPAPNVSLVRFAAGQPQPDRDGLARRDGVEAVPERGLGARRRPGSPPTRRRARRGC